MKRIFFLMICLSLLSSCEQKKSAEKNIVGTWHPVELNVAGMTEAEKKEAVDFAVLTFTANGDFTSKMSDKSSEKKATYTFNEKEKTLVIHKSGDMPREEFFTIDWEGAFLLMTNKDGTVKLRKE